MRVITGLAKGRKLQTLPDETVRPTTDFVKQAIFNSIQFDVEGRRVLDLFAGSGQLGIEALSRGAASADFVDSAKAAVNVVKANLQHCRLQENAQVILSEAMTFLQRGTGKYDLIFLDPPYGSGLLPKVLSEMIRIDILRNGGIIVCESAADFAFAVEPPFSLKGQNTYGGKTVTLYTRGAS